MNWLIKQRYLFSFLFIFLGCVSKEQPNYSYSLSKTETSYVLTLDSLTPPDTYMIQYIYQDTIWKNPRNIRFALLNKDQNTIELFNDTGIGVSKISIPLYLGVKVEVDGFSILNLDSILVYERSAKNLYLLNRSTNNLKLIKKLGYYYDNKDYLLPEFFVNVRTPIYHANNGASFITGRVFPSDPIDKPQTKKIVMGAMLNLNNSDINYFSYTENLLTQRYWHNEQYFIKYAFNSREKIIAFSLPMKDSIVVFKADSSNVAPKYYYAGSDTYNEENSFIPEQEVSWKNLGSFKDIDAFMKLPRFDNLIFDHYRNVYYRTLTKGHVENRTTFIILLDENFKKIGESELPKGYFSTSGHFLSQDGIYLRKYLENEENRIHFTLFKLKKI